MIRTLIGCNYDVCLNVYIISKLYLRTKSLLSLITGMVIELQFEDPSNEKQSADKTSEQEAVLETSGVETEGLGMSSMIIT